MRKDRRVAVFAVALALAGTSFAGAGCRGAAIPPNIEPSPSSLAPSAPPSTSVVKSVPAETPFAVELATELNSATGRAGDPFRARVVTPLEAADGDTIVSVDAELLGHVVAVRRPPDPAILVRFDLIETRWGARPVAALFTQVQPEPSVVGLPPRYSGYDAELERAGGIKLDDRPSGSSGEAGPPVVLPPGARLQMVLTDELAVRAPAPDPYAE
jgi:hypothetical protein